jgi:hypothetical protein
VRSRSSDCCITSSASEEELRVHQTDAYGRVRHDKPSYSVGSDGRIVEVDQYGNKQYHKRQFIIRKDRVYETNSYGRISTASRPTPSARTGA